MWLLVATRLGVMDYLSSETYKNIGLQILKLWGIEINVRTKGYVTLIFWTHLQNMLV